jgi:hypothetical protein
MEVWQLKTQKTLNFSQFEEKEIFFTKKKKTLSILNAYIRLVNY